MEHGMAHFAYHCLQPAGVVDLHSGQTRSGERPVSAVHFGRGTTNAIDEHDNLSRDEKDLFDVLLDPVIVAVHTVSPYVGLFRYESPVLQKLQAIIQTLASSPAGLILWHCRSNYNDAHLR